MVFQEKSCKVLEARDLLDKNPNVSEDTAMLEARTITELREDRGMTLAEAAQRAGWSRSKWHTKEAGTTKIKPHEMRVISQVLGVTPQEIVKNTENPLDRQVPLLDFVQAGKLAFPPYSYEGIDMHAKGFVSGSEGLTDKAFAMPMEGMSMVPTLPDGAIVICEPLLGNEGDRVRDGTIVAVWPTPKQKGKGVIWEDVGVIGRWFYIPASNRAEIRMDNLGYPSVQIDLSRETALRIARVAQVRINFRPIP